VVDGGGLENHCGGNSTGGSNPSPSARSMTYRQRLSSGTRAERADFPCSSPVRRESGSFVARFKPGAPVQHKSGGRKTTVSQVLGGNLYACTWFAGDDVKGANFREDDLMPFPPEGDSTGKPKS
jgi:uncharacterized protein YodC (DUF2158 family)